MQAVLTQIHRANMKALLLSRMNLILVGLDGIAMLMFIITWAIQVKKEGGGLLARYGACIIGFILLAVCMALSVMVQNMQPKLSLFYAHEVFAVLTLILISIAMGMNNVVVDLCHRKEQLGNTHCGSHAAQTVAYVIVILTTMITFASTQQRIVTFIDKGILDGIKGRSNGGVTQLA